MATVTSTTTWKIDMNELDEVIRRIRVRSREIPENNIKRFNKRAKASAPVLTGNMKKSHEVEKHDRYHWSQTVNAPYGIYVNFGTRYQRAQPWWSQAWALQTRIFRGQVKRMMKP